MHMITKSRNIEITLMCTNVIQWILLLIVKLAMTSYNFMKAYPTNASSKKTWGIWYQDI